MRRRPETTTAPCSGRGRDQSGGDIRLKNPPPTQLVQDKTDAPDQQDSAAPLALGETVNGRAQGSVDVDWYRVIAPKDDNTLKFTLSGVPTVDVTVRVYDAAGAEVPVTRSVGGDSSIIVYSATVTPEAEYTIKVAQPPHSIVFAFDTSISLSPYQPLIQQSLRSFAGGIEKGQEFVQVVPFEADPLLETWADDSYLVYAAINGYGDTSSSELGRGGNSRLGGLAGGSGGRRRSCS